MTGAMVRSAGITRWLRLEPAVGPAAIGAL